jgi:type III secretion protein C
MTAGLFNMPYIGITAKLFSEAKRAFAAICASALILCTPLAADAPPFANKPVEIIGRGQKMDSFIKDLFGQGGLKVRVSSAVAGNIQGKFTGTPEEIWRPLSKAYNLVSYYDGAIVSVYAANEIQTRTFASENPGQVLSEAKKLRLVDNNNTIKAGSANVIAIGVPAFIQRIEAIAANRVAVKPVSEPVSPVSPAITRGAVTDVISPIAGKPGITASSPIANDAGVRSTVRARATARFPYEVRVFYLRYANAQDVFRNSGGSQVIIPGVASVLRGIMGDGRASETVTSGGNPVTQRRAYEQGVNDARSDRDDDSDYDPRPRGNDNNAGDVNGPRIEIDVASGAIIVRDRPEAMATYESLIASLDIEPTQVELEATIIELNMTRAKELGLDFGFNTGGVSAVFGGTLNQATSAPSGGFSASYLTGAGSLFTARLTALERSGTARVVSKPRFITMNNLEGIFSAEREEYVALTGERTTDLQVVTAGLVLRVKPAIIYDGGELRTRLEIYIQDGSVVRDASGNPSVQRSQLSTNAVVKQGEAVLVGGMTVTSQYDDKSKTPVLGDIPVVGNAFKKRNKGGARIERLFLITPRVMTLSSSQQMASTQDELIPIEALEGKKVKGSKKGRTYR